MTETFFRTLKHKLAVSFLAVRFVSAINRVYLIWVFLKELINALKVLPYMYLLKKAVSGLEEPSGFRAYIFPVFYILSIIFILEWTSNLLDKIIVKSKLKLDFLIKEQIIEKTDALDYFVLSTKEYFVLQSKAMEGYGQGAVEENVHLFFSLISNLILLSGIGVVILSLGPALLLPICMTIAVRILSEFFDRKAGYIRRTEMPEVNRKSNYLHKICEDIRFAKEIRIFHLENKFDAKLREISREKVNIWKRYMGIFRYSSATYVIADIILQLVIYLILAYRVLVLRTIQVSDFVFFFSAYQQMQNVMGNLASGVMNIFLNADYLDDFMSYWYFKPLEAAREGDDELKYSEDDDIVIEFKNVSFRYPNTDFDALSDINIKLKKGNTYLIVGKNGAGKSTFIKLLCRLYSPTMGTITLNGKNILEYDRNAYLSLLSVLFQDYKFLNLTVADNISSLEEAFDKDIFHRVVTDVGIEEKIQALPNKEYTIYGKEFDKNGVRFSGGELQKMMIAKTLYKQSPLKIFDEPTAGLDAVAEYNIYERMRQVSEKGILIYITHRLSTGVNSDNILVFSQGKIIEKGSHSQLMDQKGEYASLFEAQAALYAGGDSNGHF